jgi:VWFA-related protein
MRTFSRLEAMRPSIAMMLAGGLLLAAQEGGAQTGPPPATRAGENESMLVVTGASQQDFPRIAVQFEVRRSDGSFLRDATRDEFRVVEDGKEVKVLEFQAPQTRELIPTTIVLVVDHSGSMEQERRIEGLKAAVASFLERMPEGSKVAVVAFSSEVSELCEFTTDYDHVRRVVNRLRPGGATRFYDAVEEALGLLDQETGRRVVLALTDGQDTASERADAESVIASARRLGLPVYTLGLGSEREIASDALRQLATETRGQYYSARNAEQLRSIYETIAERIGASYNLVYESDRRLPDGTLRPVQVFHRGSAKAGQTSVFIPGMVVPAGGWSPLFLLLLAGLSALSLLPSWMSRRRTD